jgi:hypothetical protein
MQGANALARHIRLDCPYNFISASHHYTRLFYWDSTLVAGRSTRLGSLMVALTADKAIRIFLSIYIYMIHVVINSARLQGFNSSGYSLLTY